MPKTISLRDFLLTGEFGGIQHDTRPEQVSALLGKADHRYDEDSGVTHFLYGWYELAFFEGAAMYLQNHAIQSDPSDRLFQNQRINVDPWIFDRPTPLTKPEIVTALSKCNGAFRNIIYNGRDAIQMASGVILDFNPSIEDATRIVCDAISLTFPDFRTPLRETAG